MMKFGSLLMSDAKVISAKLGGKVERSKRNEWCCKVEPVVRSLCPFPISYDVSCTQPAGFSEYTYTEFTSGVWVATQSNEINARLMELAARYRPMADSEKFRMSVSDKYSLKPLPEKWAGSTDVCFMPGTNRIDVASQEIVSRLFFENDKVVLKPHPITEDSLLKSLGRRFGWNRIVDKDVSGFALLAQCETVYTTSASEMAITGTALGKRVVNVSNFFHEGAGAYHPISKILFKAHRDDGIVAAQEALSSIINCPWSGLIFPWDDDVDSKLADYYAKSLELRGFYKQVAYPM